MNIKYIHITSLQHYRIFSGVDFCHIHFSMYSSTVGVSASVTETGIFLMSTSFQCGETVLFQTEVTNKLQTCSMSENTECWGCGPSSPARRRWRLSPPKERLSPGHGSQANRRQIKGLTSLSTPLLRKTSQLLLLLHRHSISQHRDQSTQSIVFKCSGGKAHSSVSHRLMCPLFPFTIQPPLFTCSVLLLWKVTVSPNM